MKRVIKFDRSNLVQFFLWAVTIFPVLGLSYGTFSVPLAGKDFVPPYDDPNLKLEGLLALNLHEFSGDVEEIADQVRWPGVELTASVVPEMQSRGCCNLVIVTVW